MRRIRHAVVLSLMTAIYCISANDTAPLSREQAIATYINVREATYVQQDIAQKELDRVYALSYYYPDTYMTLNDMTDATSTIYYLPAWLAWYVDPVAARLSSLWGGHNTILDALRPPENGQPDQHRRNVAAYLNGVKQYLYNTYEIADYSVRDIFAQMLLHLDIASVNKLPHDYNLFMQIIPTISKDDVTYIIDYLRKNAAQEFAVKKDMLLSLLTHYAYTQRAVQAIAYDITHNEEHKETS